MLPFVYSPVKEFTDLRFREKKVLFVFFGYFKIGMRKRNDGAGRTCDIAAFLAIMCIRIKIFFCEEFFFLSQ